MAITVTTLQPRLFGFILNGVTDDASSCEELKAAPSAGQSIVIDHLTVNNGANAISITIGQGEAAGAVESALIGPIAMAANSSIQWDFGPAGLKMTAAKSLTVDSSGAGAVCVFVIGRVE